MNTVAMNAFNDLRWRLEVQSALLRQAKIVTRVYTVLDSLKKGESIEDESLTQLEKWIDEYFDHVKSAVDLTEVEIERLENA